MKLLLKSILLIGLTAISCKQNQALSEITFYFKDGDVLSGYTPEKSPHKRGQYIEWRKKEKSIWFHEMDRDYLKAFKIDQDSFSIVPSNTRHKIFAINKEQGLIDLYLYPHIADSCVTSDFILAMDLMMGLLEVASVFAGGEQCREDYDYFEDDDCHKIIRYKTEDYILVSEELGKTRVTRLNFSKEKLLEYFSKHSEFESKLTEQSVLFDDIPVIVRNFNSRTDFN